jgi:hypothetical protein
MVQAGSAEDMACVRSKLRAEGMAQRAACHLRSMCDWKGSGTGIRKYEKKAAQKDQEHYQSLWT